MVAEYLFAYNVPSNIVNIIHKIQTQIMSLGLHLSNSKDLSKMVRAFIQT